MTLSFELYAKIELRASLLQISFETNVDMFEEAQS